MRQLNVQARDFAFELDADGRVTDATEAARHVLGMPRDELIGQSLFALADDEQGLQLAQAFRDACGAGEVVCGYEIRVLRPDEERRWLRVDAFPLPLDPEQGEDARRYRGLARDVSAEKRARADAEALRARLERTLRAARDALVEWPDLTRDAVRIAPALAEQIGLPPTASAQLTQLVARIAREDRPRLREAFREHLRAGTPLDLELRLRDTKRYFHVRAEASSCFDAPGFGMIASIREVTRDDGSLPRARTAIHAAGAGVFEWNTESGACSFDDACSHMLGYRAASLPAALRNWLQMVHPADHGMVRELFDACASADSRPFRARLRLRCVGGQWRWVELAGTVTRQHTASGLQLDVDVEQRALLEMDDARQRAEASSRAKSEFLANMSHEIRTPMTAILGFADVARGEVDDAVTRDESLELVQRNGERLLRILDDILDLSKIEAGRLEVESTDVELRALFGDIAESMRVRAMDKEIRTSVECDARLPRFVLTDPLRLSQILGNLSSNAIKFTESGSVSVRAELVREDDARARVRFTVEDTGRGMSAEELRRVQQPFMQACSSTSRHFGGTGLGLAISKSLAELLGGSLSLESEAGVGTVASLELELPVRDVEVASSAREMDDFAAAPTELRSGVLADTRILLAEDGEDNRRLLVHFLEKAGATVEVACDGREALERFDAAAADTLDMVVMDMQMPELDGYAATRAIRESGVQIPILALTAHAMRGDAERCLAAGCDVYATKPIGGQKLVALCAGLIAQHRADIAGAV